MNQTPNTTKEKQHGLANLFQQEFFIKGTYEELMDFIYTGETLNLEDVRWKELLPEWEYYVLRKKGTERAFTGLYYRNWETGIYQCAACGLPLFHSSTKFDSGTGWPSFFQPIKKNKEAHRIKETVDTTMGILRIEILCFRCGSHLGHVFPDGPSPTGLRYCVNSTSLYFVKKR